MTTTARQGRGRPEQLQQQRLPTNTEDHPPLPRQRHPPTMTGNVGDPVEMIELVQAKSADGPRSVA